MSHTTPGAAPYGVGAALLLHRNRRYLHLGPVHMQVLELVCGASAPPAIDAIAQRIGRHRSRISRAVQDLEDLNFVQRTLALSDRRRTLVCPTAKARALDQQVRAWLANRPAA
jgi:DNA-binding MarR family transcriptional regulator